MQYAEAERRKEIREHSSSSKRDSMRGREQNDQ